MVQATLVLLTLCGSALANIFAISPVASTVYTAGQPATITWQDDGASPSLAQFGLAKVSIYVGNRLQQTRLQEIVSSANVSSASNIQFIPSANIGPNSNQYFIRFESLTLKDPKEPQYPALAFSSKFTLTGMTGKFSNTIQAQINGQSTAPIAAPTAPPQIAGSSTAAVKGPTITATPSSNSAATHFNVGWMGALLSAAMGISML